MVEIEEGVSEKEVDGGKELDKESDVKDLSRMDDMENEPLPRRSTRSRKKKKIFTYCEIGGKPSNKESEF